MIRLFALLLTIAALPARAVNPEIPDPATLGAIGHLGRLGPFGGGCTASVIGPDRIATAGHCAGPPGQKGRTHQPFVAGLTEGASTALGMTQSFQRLPKNKASTEIERDVAILRLRLPRDSARPLTVTSPPEKGETLVVAGYPGDLAGGRQIVHCGVQERTDRLIYLDCSARSGMSGSPLLRYENGEWRIAGIMVATRGDQGSLAVTFDPAEFP
ncbi:hypothetical protein OCGS_2272 [Oceaniovalibus guishaninsula JLT2003]|uniref:Serine protease n=1 Tax=Oceaniovalibus guishaninsula JLT2003 TaxID=1231392 RepID=K2I3V3_9RHOB|nr:serine protease [Oceaniovalibus guishaninsula]EKE43540.1 hypothetical protein OCGS_2272 [Oceaniovalibus guishaninsula JLT2003]